MPTARGGARSAAAGREAGGGAQAPEGPRPEVDELASNGLRHGRAPVRVHAVRTAQGLLLDVRDGDPHHGPQPAVGRDPALGGTGLRVVAELTTDRGWTVAGDREHVWACFLTDGSR